MRIFCFLAFVFLLEMYNDFMSELPTNPEDTIEKRIVRLMREKGPEDPEARSLLVQWIEEQQKIADSTPNPVGRYDLAINKAQLYRDAGLVADATQALEDALQMAVQEGEPDCWDRVYSELQKMDQ